MSVSAATEGIQFPLIPGYLQADLVIESYTNQVQDVTHYTIHYHNILFEVALIGEQSELYLMTITFIKANFKQIR